MKVIKKTGRWLLYGCIVLVLLQCKILAKAGLSDNPYASFSPDGEAYTIDAGVKDTEWYKLGTVVKTGVQPQLAELKTGEHYYEYAVTGEVPVGYWRVMLSSGRCIHNTYIEENFFHGVPFGKRKCYQSYFSGWMPYCADCGEQVASVYYYMSEGAAKNTQCIDVSKAYYYKCPHCDNLEQAVKQYAHICKAVSANRYFVNYQPNEGNGYMGRSAHIYNDAQVYEGREVTPQTNLSLNSFTRTGYVFTGWNTMPDGTGTAYADGAKIWNLSEEEGGQVTLYAQWKICQSQLCIDPNGGTYAGSSKPVIVPGAYGEKYKLEMEKLLPPAGNVVHFETGQGNPVADMTGEKKFEEWILTFPFCGKLDTLQYTFSDKESATDYLTAVYTDREIILPGAFREGYSFGGWYRDSECTQLVGGAGSRLVPTAEMTLYAGWVDLQLESEDNYMANQGRGAVNLSWMQKDDEGKVYLIYQRTEDTEWKQLGSKTVTEDVYEVDMTVEYSEVAESFTVPYSGLYQLTICGAQGGNYGVNIGGKGGMVEAGIYLERGERLHCYVGGQSGVPGGGTGLLYENGGGYSMVSSETKGLLMIAGGGGGASETEDGLPGGSRAGVTENQNGESGACGGGGGYFGGRAGEVLIHHHDENCRHVHTGQSGVFGGCYSVPVYCSGIDFEKKEKSRKFYYGNIDDYGNHIFCVRCGSDYCPGHLDIKYYYECQTCKSKYDSEIKRCVYLVEYALGCGRTEAYVCGCEEGQILSSQAAYGGSNYINTDFCTNYSMQSGINEGNGTLRLVSKIVGTIRDNQLKGVIATDLAKPDRIDENTVRKVAAGENEIRISFKRPTDNGTKYYHQVKSVDVMTNQIVCTSNETVNTLTTGVVGYVYVVDYLPETRVDATAKYYAAIEENPSIVVEMDAQIQYLHIAPMDRAGNVGATTHIKISNQDVIYWPVMTQQLMIQEGENVMQTESGEFYVRADGVTPFEIEMDAYICGTAGTDYQIDNMNIITYEENTVQESIYSVITPRKNEILPGMYMYPMQQLQKKVWGEPHVQDAGYTYTKRFHYCRNLKMIQRFVMEQQFHGHKIYLVPQAGVQTAEGIIYSAREQDVQNCICVIADGKGPEISGLELLEDADSLDFSKGDTQDIHVYANDADSGLEVFYVEIYNMENGSVLRYEDSRLNGHIAFTISDDNIVFHGKFSIVAYARDRVGNESIVGKDLLGIGLYAYVERVLEPHTGMFKRGETGILHIQTTGYIERVEVFFQQDLLQEGESNPIVYTYEIPEYIQTEEKEFTIPLTACDGEKTIKVIAYKEGTELEKEPQLLIIQVEGSILDELRTRLR